ncbi:nodulation protein NfeD [Lentibacillus cibarius]|uniref:Nodulation protein NfeD n=1 Tax=Lentibacillus cibarius TaxID=2583219 RepID=A0A549YLJ7_9BACI|nr:nodulation protein NfeD [Lentibacillus cibarius]TRM12744.1 nodulation protein NfeD [Lentibacillus cibarius]
MASARMKRYMLCIMTVIVLGFAAAVPVFSADSEEGSGKLIYVIPIEKEVEMGLKSFLQRTTSEAEEKGADHIIFKIDTPGGAVAAAEQIGELLQGLETETTAYIVNRALSAGSYIALNTDNIYMKPHATIGASGVINQDGTAANKKAQSAWLSAMKSAAESKGRNPKYAAAMADPNIDLPKYAAEKGKFLTLGPSSAKEVGYSRGTVENREVLLDKLGLSGAELVEKNLKFSEHIARFITNPVIVPILLSIASLGLITELFSPGFGIPGGIGIASLVLFFYGHAIAGLAGMEEIILLIIGAGLIVAEFFLPGGIAGLLGSAAIVWSLLLSGQDLSYMVMSISIAFIITFIAAMIMIKKMGMRKGFFRYLILEDQTSSEKGYVSSKNRQELIGVEGKTITPLRPSGTAIFNEERLDVVTEGGFIDKGKRVKVIRVEGVRVVVREI